MTFKKDTTVEISMPEGYTFEFETIALNQEPSVSLHLNDLMARLRWFLKYKGSTVEYGEYSLRMDAENPQAQMFIYGRRKARDHIERVNLQNNFVFRDMRVVYECPRVMTLDRGFFEAYNF